MTVIGHLNFFSQSILMLYSNYYQATSLKGLFLSKDQAFLFQVYIFHFELPITFFDFILPVNSFALHA